MAIGYYTFHNPARLLVGAQALEQLPFELASLGSSRPLIVADAGVRRAGLLGPVVSAFESAGVSIGAEFDDVPPDSSLETVAACARKYRENNCDSIIAIGGGSVLDTAKAANVLVSEGGDDLTRYSGSGALKRALRPLVAIPTTAGTGSEVTQAAVVADSARGVKVLLTSPFLVPAIAVVDPRMTLTLPPLLTAATAMDALTHAIEATLGLSQNPVSDAFAFAAIERVASALPAVLAAPRDIEARTRLAEGATLAGVAFSSSMTSLVHALGHSLGAACHIHHGTCMSVLLPHVLELHLGTRRAAIGALLLPLSGAEAFARTAESNRAEAAIAAVRTLQSVAWERAGLPRTLRETERVKREQLDAIAARTLDDGALTYSPTPVDFAGARAILERAW
jgi:alcohol dehydrogenase